MKKAFLKPTIGKTGIFIIVVVILLILIRPRSICANCVNCPCYVQFITINHYIIPFSIGLGIVDLFVAYLIEIIISYLIASLILLIYNKPKVKKR